MHGLYVHFPFCRSKCHYCGFYSVPAGSAGEGAMGRYLASLRAELEQRLGEAGGLTFDTIYFGGGTPSLMDPGETGSLLDFISSRAAIASGCEISLEMNPPDAVPARLNAFRDAGVNRITLGVQTLSERLHGIIGRSVAPCSVRVLDDFFSAPGMAHCVDLITGIPGQSDEELERDLEAVTSYRPGHISSYLLSVEEGTPLESRVKKDHFFEEEQRRLYYRGIDILAGKGYAQYEISNFAFPGEESRHNMKYWTFMPYLGIGAGAHSFTCGERFYNRMSLDEYLASPFGCRERDARTGDSEIMEFLMTGLRLIRGVKMADLSGRFNYSPGRRFHEKIRELQGRGLVESEEGGGGMLIRITREGLILADAVIFDIVDALG